MCRIHKVAGDTTVPAVMLVRAPKHEVFRLKMKVSQNLHLIASPQPPSDPMFASCSNEARQNHCKECEQLDNQAFMTPYRIFRSPLLSPPPLEHPTSARQLEPMPYLLPKEILFPEF